MQHSHIHVSTISPFQFQQNPPSSFDENSLPDSTKLPLKFPQNAPSGFDENLLPVSTKTALQSRQDPHTISSFDETPLSDSTKTPLQFRQDPSSPSSFDENPLPVSTKTALQFRQNPPSSFDENPGLQIQGSTRVFIQPPPLLTREIVPREGDALCGGGDLILPPSPLPDERESALVGVQGSAPHAQALIDELATRLPANAVPTSFDEHPRPDSTKTPLQFQQKRHPSFDKSAKLSKQRSTRVLVQQPLTGETIPCEGDAQGGGDLILPETLLPEERQAALVLVRRCAPHAQALLDELAARIQANAVHTSPLAYLRGLVRRALAGEFVPELGQRVAAVRRKQEEELASRRRGQAEEQRVAVESGTPEHQARLESRRAQLRQIASALKAGLALETRS